MFRVVTAEHIVFKECINFFRADENPARPLAYDNNSQVKGYVLLDFKLEGSIDLPGVRIESTRLVDLPNAHRSYIAPVILFNQNDRWRAAHLYLQALSSILSFVSGRPVVAPRGHEFINSELDTKEDELALAIKFPVICAGLGATDTQRSKKSLTRDAAEIEQVMHMLYEMPYDKYIRFMQAIRLIHLSYINKRNDFSLSYFLLVSAIESIAQLAIEKTVSTHPYEEKWEELAAQDKAVRVLLSELRQYQTNSHQLTKRFTQFILKYCPPQEWSNLEHPNQEKLESLRESPIFSGSNAFEGLADDLPFELHPEKLGNKDIKKLIQNTYEYRSKFTHEGRDVPHAEPTIYTRFFDVKNVIGDKGDINEVIAINYRLLSYIAKNSIMNYMVEIVQTN